MVDPKFLLRDLLTSVARLSWGARDQRMYLEELGVAPLADELGLELHDALQPAERLVREGLLPADALTAARALHAKLEGVPIDHREAFWTVDALDSDPLWDEVRGLAARAASLAGQNVDSTTPYLPDPMTEAPDDDLEL